MACSLESRLPLLDKRVVEFLATITPEQKIVGMVPKYLLRDVASKLIPEKVWKRNDKKPFPMPTELLLTPAMLDMKRELFLSRESMERGIFSKKTLQNAVTDATSWPIFSLELWFRIFIDGDSSLLP